MAKKEAKEGKGDALFVKSKVKDHIKAAGCNTAGDLVDGDALNKVITGLLDAAIARAKANGRKTVQSKDL